MGTQEQKTCILESQIRPLKQSYTAQQSLVTALGHHGSADIN